MALFALGRATGLDEYVTRDRIRDTMQNAGPAGFAMYILLFTIGLLVQIPGFVFVAGAALAYGWFLCALASIVASFIGVVVSFVLVRKVGGQPLAQVEKPLLKRMLDRLEKHPVQTIVKIRFFLWALPVVNYTLAMSNVKLKDYVIGSGLGLIAPMFYLSVFFDWFLNGGAERLFQSLNSFFV